MLSSEPRTGHCPANDFHCFNSFWRQPASLERTS